MKIEKFKKLSTIIFLSLVGILTAGVISYAWVEPSDSPPSGNVSGIFGLLREDGSLVIDGDIRAKDFLVNYTNESGTSVSKSITELVDKDNDGYTAREGDCDDGNADIYPGAAPRYDSGKDYDCSGTNEYTIDHYSNVYAPTACTKGGNFVNFQGYVYGYKCIEKVHTNMGYECKDNVYHSNEELVYTMYNNKSKYYLCLYENHYSNDSALVMGTSGGNYSCGGHSEQSIALQKKYGRFLPRYNGGSDNVAIYTKGYWRFWCN